MSNPRKTAIAKVLAAQVVAHGITIQQLKDSISEEKLRLMHKIMRKISKKSGLSSAVIIHSRGKKAFIARASAMATLYVTGYFSLHDLGAFFGGRHHTTVLNAIARANGLPLVNSSPVAYMRFPPGAWDENWHRVEQELGRSLAYEDVKLRMPSAHHLETTRLT